MNSNVFHNSLHANLNRLILCCQNVFVQPQLRYSAHDLTDKRLKVNHAGMRETFLGLKACVGEENENIST